MLGLALLYFVTGRLGLLLPAFDPDITLLWLPSGIAVAALTRWGFGCWPGVALGAAAVNFAGDVGWASVLGIAAANTAGPLLTAWILRRSGFHPEFDHKRDILLLAVAAMPGTLVSASLGVVMLGLSAGFRGDCLTGWLVRWAGNITGVIAATPLVLVWTRNEWRSIALRRAEFFIWIGITCATVSGVCLLNTDPGGAAWELAFLPLPMLAWAALRFGAIGTSLGIILLSVGAAYGTATDRGPLNRANQTEEIVGLWLFMATCAVLGWLIAALHASRLKAVGIQRLFEQALNDISLGVIFGDLARKITYANEGFTRLTGYTETEVLGQSWRILHGPETDPAAEENLTVAVRDGGLFDGEIVNYRKDGTMFWNRLLVSPIRNEHAEMTGHLALQHDITERKRAEDALRVASQKLKLHFERTPMAVIEWDLEFRVTQWNPAARTIFGFTHAEALGQHASFIVPEKSRPHVEDVWRALLKKNGGERSSNENVRKDGERILCDWYNTPLIDERGAVTGVASLVMDVTERRRAEEAIRALNASLERRVQERTAELQAANKELEAFSYSVSHDLRAPVRTMDGFSRIVAKRYADRLDEDGQKMLGMIQAGARQMGRLIDDLLAFSGMGRQALAPSPIAMHALAQAVFDSLAGLEPERKLRLHLHPLPPAHGTPGMIRQVWMNLIGNAIKFTAGREVAEIEIGTQTGANGEVIYCVRDNGAGFDMRFADKIFEVFQRLHSMEEFEGTGVGLALVQRVVERHGGKIWAEGKVDGGAAFFFTLQNPEKRPGTA